MLCCAVCGLGTRNVCIHVLDVCDGAGVKLAYSPTMEVGYHAYATRMKVSLPLTEQHLKTQVRNMPDPASQLIFCYETITHGDVLH